MPQTPTPETSEATDQSALQDRTNFLKSYEGILKNPAIQKGMKALADPAITSAVQQFGKIPNVSQLVYTEIGWLVVLVIFKAWRSSKLLRENWIRRLFLSLTFYILLWSGVLIGIPWIFIGDRYFALVRGVIDAVSKL